MIDLDIEGCTTHAVWQATQTRDFERGLDLRWYFFPLSILDIIKNNERVEWNDPKFSLVTNGLDIVNWVGPVLIPIYLLEVLFRGAEKWHVRSKIHILWIGEWWSSFRNTKKKIQKKRKTLKRIKHYNKNKKLSFNFV